MTDRLPGEYRFSPDDLSAHEYWLKFRPGAPEGQFVSLHMLGRTGPTEFERLSLARGTLRFIALADPNLVLRMRLRSCKPEERCEASMPECLYRCLLPPRHPGLHVAHAKEHEHYYGPVVATRYSIEIVNLLREVDSTKEVDLMRRDALFW